VEKSDFLVERARLEREFLAEKPNLGSYRSEACELCDRCMFCSACRECFRCTHCSRCTNSSECSHCSECATCHACTYCIACQFCSGGAYLEQCVGCADCTYCFGCVGLVKREFYILNVPYSRTQYFEIVAQLREDLAR
jgi:hypothetical protein